MPSTPRAFLPLLLTTSLFLLHCSGEDSSPSSTPGTGGTAAATGGSPATGGVASPTGGSPSTGGVATTGGSTNPTGGSPATGGSMASGGSGGTTGGVGGAPSGGAAAGGMSAGSGGMSGAPSGGATAGGMSGGDGGAGMGGGGGSDTGGMSGAAAGGGGSDMMTLTSTVITEGDMFPDDNTCAGANTSPDLTWTAGPAGTMSYAMILLDTSNSLNHWVMWDIPASVTSLPAGLGTEAMPSEPAGAKQKAFQGNGYTGPCPSGSDHLYEFTVYALPVATLSSAMTSQQTSALAMEVMDADPLGSASLSAHSSASRNQ